AAALKLTTGLGGLGRVAENLTGDALALGYFIREAEGKLNEELSTFEPDYVERLNEASKEDPIMALTAGAYAVAEGMPKAFSFVAEIWEETVERAQEALLERQPLLLDALGEADAVVTVTREHRDQALKNGYGICLTAQALDIRAIVTRD